MHFALVDAATSQGLFHWLPTAAELNKMFGVGLSILEKMVRPIIVYIFLVAVLRVFGKRELAQLNPFDLVVLLSLSNTVQNAIIGDDNSLTGGIVGAFALLLTNYLVVRFVFKHRRLDQLIEGTPTVLIENGKLKKQALAKELLTQSELVTMAHRQGFSNLKEVEKCVLEPGGTFYMQGKEPSTPERLQAEILKRLDDLSRQIEELKQEKG
ncbi:MAG: YetF domain-containing protein [Pyrinomonadaceae bacterium]